MTSDGHVVVQRGCSTRVAVAVTSASVGFPRCGSCACSSHWAFEFVVSPLPCAGGLSVVVSQRLCDVIPLAAVVESYIGGESCDGDG